MAPRLVIGSASAALGTAIAAMLDADIAETTVERFPDGESHVATRQSISGDDVYIVQSAGPPVDEPLIELLMLVDACRRPAAAGSRSSSRISAMHVRIVDERRVRP